MIIAPSLLVAPDALGRVLLATPDEHGRRHLSAAAGLVGAPDGSGAAWMVADDVHALVRLPGRGRPGQLVPLLEPEQRGGGRRPRKPDLEALVELAPAAGVRHGALLALGSGAKARPSRERGALVVLDVPGAPVGAPTQLALGPLYDALRMRLGGDVNVEGAAVRQGRLGAELVLAHRGRDGTSALVVLDHDAAIAAALAGRSWDGSLVRQVHELRLGEVDGVPLALSDIRALADGRLVATASAEGPDGRIAGSAVGVIDATLATASMHPLAGPPRKVEAIELASRLPGWAPQPASSGALELVLATDPDDPARAAELLYVALPAPAWPRSRAT